MLVPKIKAFLTGLAFFVFLSHCGTRIGTPDKDDTDAEESAGYFASLKSIVFSKSREIKGYSELSAKPGSVATEKGPIQNVRVIIWSVSSNEGELISQGGERYVKIPAKAVGHGLVEFDGSFKINFKDNGDQTLFLSAHLANSKQGFTTEPIGSEVVRSLMVRRLENGVSVFPAVDKLHDKDEFRRQVVAASMENGFYFEGPVRQHIDSFYVLGNLVSSGRTVVSKYDSKGAKKWDVNIGNQGANQPEFMSEVTQSGFYVGGKVRLDGREAGHLAKLDKNGRLKWANSYKLDTDTGFGSLVEHNEEEIWAIGTTWRPDNSTQAPIIAILNQDGSVQSCRIIDTPEDGILNSSVFTSSKDFILAGRMRHSSEGHYDALLVKLDVKGSIKWAVTVGSEQFEESFQTIETRDGNILIAGYTTGVKGNKFDGYLAKFSPDGNLLWARSYGGGGVERIHDVVESVDGDILAVGFTPDEKPGSNDALLLRLTQDGEVKWAKTYGGNESETFRGVYETSSGDLFLTGTANNQVGAQQGGLLIKTDSKGEVAPGHSWVGNDINVSTFSKDISSVFKWRKVSLSTRSVDLEISSDFGETQVNFESKLVEKTIP